MDGTMQGDARDRLVEPNYGANAVMGKSSQATRLAAATDTGLDSLDGLINQLHSSAYQLETKVDGLRARLVMGPVYDTPTNANGKGEPEECPSHRIHNQIIQLRKLGQRIDRASAHFDTLIETIS